MNLKISKKDIEFPELPIEYVLKNTHIPVFQRVEDDEHTLKIFEGLKLHYETFNEIFLPGTISVAKTKQNPKFILFDGQHRINALKKLSQIYDISKELIRVDIYNVSTDEQISQLYTIINSNKKVELFTGNLEPVIIPAVQKYFKKVFPSFCKSTKNPKNLNINLDILGKHLEGYKVVEKLNIQSADQLIDIIRSLNTFYSCQNEEFFVKYGIKDFSKKYEEFLQPYENPLYLGLFRHFEWIERLLENVEYSKQNHFVRDLITKDARRKIPRNVRRAVWDKKFEGKTNGSCYCCEHDIDIEDFDCGHVLSVKDGGDNGINNLEAICRKCNFDMGTMHMEKYKELFQK